MIKISDMAEVERLQAEGMKVVAISSGSPQVFTIDDGKNEPKVVDVPDVKNDPKKSKKGEK